MAYSTPGVYVKEVSTLPPSVAQVETAIPAFIGYTETAKDRNGQLINSFPYSTRINSYKEYEERFGEGANIYVDSENANAARMKIVLGVLEITTDSENEKFNMPYTLQMHFANGGGPCYICAVETYADASFEGIQDMEKGLEEIGKEDEPTILVFPDAQGLESGYYNLFQKALQQCSALGDRVVLIDIQTTTGTEAFDTLESDFRNGIGNNHLKYGIAYYPMLKTILNYQYDEAKLAINVDGEDWRLKNDSDETKSVFHAKNEFYHKIKNELARRNVILPPSSAMTGIYSMVDSTRGVWKAPANVSLSYVKALMVDIDDEDQKQMNIHGSGKSVNAIRNFTGKGLMVWGARTLAGNDNEWKYIPVRRFFNMVEESVKKATMQFVFEPNDANTWGKVRAMIENFLILQWNAGALPGAVPEDAFYVSVGLGQTMTADDILNGRMNVEIGMAIVRPAEFIILKFSHKMQES